MARSKFKLHQVFVIIVRNVNIIILDIGWKR